MIVDNGEKYELTLIAVKVYINQTCGSRIFTPKYGSRVWGEKVQIKVSKPSGNQYGL